MGPRPTSPNTYNYVLPNDRKEKASVPSLQLPAIKLHTGFAPIDAKKVIIVADPGPDPDDCKVIVAAGMLHRQGVMKTEAIICNGGHQARERTALARAILAHISMAAEIRVAVGQKIKEWKPKAHEYKIRGFDSALQSIQRSPGTYDGATLFLEILQKARAKTLTIQLQTGMTDVANVIRTHGDLFERKVSLCSIMGGLQKTPSGTWEPDTAANNMFDIDAATVVYKFCIDRKIPMHVVSRTAVPNLRMSLAKEFADANQGNVVMDYLYNAQKLGLVGLWQSVCEKKLPARCTKLWYFTTFCGLTEKEYDEYSLEEMEAGDDMETWLNGHVKPYDVVAFMTLLPDARSIFDFKKAAVEINGTTHHFFLEADQKPPLKAVEGFLSDVFTSTCIRSNSMCT